MSESSTISHCELLSSTFSLSYVFKYIPPTGHLHLRRKHNRYNRALPRKPEKSYRRQTQPWLFTLLYRINLAGNQVGPRRMHSKALLPTFAQVSPPHAFCSLLTDRSSSILSTVHSPPRSLTDVWETRIESSPLNAQSPPMAFYPS